MSSEWTWSTTLNQSVYPVVEDGVAYLILRDGRRIRASDVQAQNSINPRTPLPAQAYVSHYANVSQGYSQGGKGQYTYGSQPPAELPISQLGGMSLGEPSGSTCPASGTRRSNFPSGSNDYPNAIESEGPYGIRARIATGAYGEKVLLGTDGEQENLDPTFRKRTGSFFKVGKVFKTLWTEPAPDSQAGTHVTPVLFNQTVYTQIRRFVVVREGHQYCVAVQITTYGGRGLRKPGVVASEHALIYTGSRPETSGYDSGMIPIDILVDPDDREGLDPISRLNLGKPYTIEHKLKVKSMGMVRDKDALLRAYREALSGEGGQASSASVSRRTAREARPELNAPITPVPRPRPRTSSHGSAGSGGSNGDLEAQIRHLTAARTAGRISAEQYQQGMSRATHRADQLRRERSQQQPIEESEDEEDEDEDEDDEEDDEDGDEDRYAHYRSAN